MNPSPLIFDSSRVIFESHDLQFIILLKVVNSDANSIILYPRIYYYNSKTSRFKGQELFYLISKTSNYYQEKKKIDFLKISNCPDPLSNPRSLLDAEINQIADDTDNLCYFIAARSTGRILARFSLVNRNFLLRCPTCSSFVMLSLSLVACLTRQFAFRVPNAQRLGDFSSSFRLRFAWMLLKQLFSENFRQRKYRGIFAFINHGDRVSQYKC